MTIIRKMMASATSSGIARPSNTKLLMHFNGSDASTTMTDEIGHAFTATGSAQIDTAQSKFGDSSLLLDGTTDGVIQNATSADFTFGTGDFTLECWIRPTDLVGNDLVMGNSHTSSTSTVVRWYRSTSGITYGSGNAVIVATSSGLISADTWHHVSVNRISSTSTVYIDGVSRGSASDSNNFSLAEKFFFGDGDAGTDFSGHIDEAIVTKGSAIRTGAFTPPTSPWA